ncbi:MAG: sigma factor-like helix-turn-helix DNA-binding protein, partial [Acidiferrobacteraceae bacterium]
KLIQRLERDGVRPDLDAMASELRIDRHEVERIATLIWQLLAPPVPIDPDLDGSGKETGVTLDHLVVAESLETPEEYGWLSNVFGMKLMHSLKQLSDRELRVLTLRYGLDGAEPLTLEALGRDVGVTRERVRQIQNMALAKLRQALSGVGHEHQQAV